MSVSENVQAANRASQLMTETEFWRWMDERRQNKGTVQPVFIDNVRDYLQDKYGLSSDQLQGSVSTFCLMVLKTVHNHWFYLQNKSQRSNW